MFERMIKNLLGDAAGKMIKKVINDNLPDEFKNVLKGGTAGQKDNSPGPDGELFTPKALPGGSLPAGLYAMLDIAEDTYSVLVLSKDFSGDVRVSSAGGNETIKAEPGTWKSGGRMSLSAGIKVSVTAGDSTMELVTNYGSFPAIGYGERVPEGDFFNADTVFKSGNTKPGRKITGVYCISEKPDEMYNNPSDPAVAWFAVSASENVTLAGGAGVDVLKKASVQPGKAYYLYAHYFDETMNFVGGTGGEKIVYK